MNNKMFKQHPNILENVGVLFSGQFKRQVLEVVSRIPKGKTLTYKEVARRAGRPRAYRAVGNILNKNYNPQIPCHRVIRSDGKVGGYRGGTKKKLALLREEKALGKEGKIV